MANPFLGKCRKVERVVLFAQAFSVVKIKTRPLQYPGGVGEAAEGLDIEVKVAYCFLE